MFAYFLQAQKAGRMQTARVEIERFTTSALVVDVERELTLALEPGTSAAASQSSARQRFQAIK
jgi:hypothetical protein